MNTIRLCIHLLLVFTLASCQTNEKKSDLISSTTTDFSSEVHVKQLRTSIFRQEVLSNGVLSAAKKSDLRFKISETIQQVNVRNGQYVKAGQVLATLNKFELQQELNKSKSALKEAELDLEDELLGRGYSMNDSLPELLKQMVYIRSGYESAIREFETRQYQYEHATLRAPYDGVVANVSFQQFDQVKAGDIFCKLIDPSKFEVDFYLLESEITLIDIKDLVEVSGFDKSIYMGLIQSVNPLVEENGMVLVKAMIQNTGSLLEGMNVKIKVLKDIENQWVVPKSAILSRNDESVLFKYSQGRAKWVYVETILENSQEYAVQMDANRPSEELLEGDTVIISNNLNLAHDSQVTIRPIPINP